MTKEGYWHKIQVAEQEGLLGGDVDVEDIPETRLQVLKRRIESHDLPIRSRLESLEFCIEEAIGRSGMFLLVAETGSGKSIYSPLAVRNVLKKLGLPDRIIVLQPRKDAAKGVAEAHCAIIDGELGRDVGYSTSETKMVDRDTPVRVVTSGILPRYLFNGTVDNTNTGAIILDEVHEGSLDYHYVFGLLKELRAEGKAPFVFLTSATVDSKKFQDFFGFSEEDFMFVEGRTFPVDTKYQNERKKEDFSYNPREIAINYLSETVELVRQAIENESEGDILVFLPGAREIDDCIERLSDIEEIEILPLHGGLSFEDRNQALSGERRLQVKRRVIVATNVAETSVTVPNVTVVVDSCRRNSMKFDPDAGISRKVTELISQEEAEQRAGRAGRVEAGVCYRALTEREFSELPKRAVTEIERTNLAHLILRLRGHDRDPETFPFFVQPDKRALHAGVEQLKILGALDSEGKVTEIGKRMLDMPFKPEDARMLVEAEERGCTDAALTLALLAREQKLYVYPTAEEIDRADGFTLEERKISARNAIAAEQAQFEQDGSDWAKRLNIFIQAIEAGVFDCLGDDRQPEVKQALRNFRGWCRMYHLNPEAIKHVAYRLYDFSREAGIPFDRFELEYRLRHTQPNALNASIIAGYQENLLMRDFDARFPSYARLRRDEYKEINFSPDSSAFAVPPQFCIAGSIKEGQGKAYGGKIKRNYASQVHPVSLEEIVRLMGDKLTAKPRTEVEFDTTLGQAVQMMDYTLRSGEYRERYLGAAGVPLEDERATRILAEVIVNNPDKIADERGYLPHFWEKNSRVMSTLRQLRIRSLGQLALPDQVEWYVKRLGNVVTLEEARRMDSFLEMDIREFCTDEMRAQIERDFPESIVVNGKQRGINYESFAGDIYRTIPERFVASLQLFPEDISGIPVGTRFEVGPEDARQPLLLTMHTGSEWHKTTSLEQLRGMLGNPALSVRMQDQYRSSGRRIVTMLSDMESRRHECTQLGLTIGEYDMMMSQLRWCQERLKQDVVGDEQGEEIMGEISGIMQKIRHVLSEKREVYLRVEAERKRREDEAKEQMVQEVEVLYDDEEEGLLAAAAKVRGGRLSSYYLEIEANLREGRELLMGRTRYSLSRTIDPERALAILKEVKNELRLSEEASKGALAAAFETLRVKTGVSESVPNTVQVGPSSEVVKKIELKPQVLETVMTPEIRAELREEVAYLEVILESVLSQSTFILAESLAKIKTKAQEAAERVAKRKELRQELQDLSKEIDSDEAPTVVRGHLGKMRDSINALVKTNLPHMVVRYDKNWTEEFRRVWDEIPNAVTTDEMAQEYIRDGFVTTQELVRNIREYIGAHIPYLQKGESIKITLAQMIETALAKY